MESVPYTLHSEYDDTIYWARVNRNLGWMGDTDEEAQTRQKAIRDCTVGVAGCGGIGGSLAERLARLGIGHLKIADFDTFEYSNINRQLGAGVRTVGHNKAETVGKLVHEMTPDVEIDVYPGGIEESTVDSFFEGCDYVFDEIEPYQFTARYVLHQAFRRSALCRFMLTGHVYGNRTFIWKWTRDSMPIEEVLGVPAGAELDEKTATQLVSRLIPEPSGYPGPEMQRRWLVENTTCPIVPGAPPLSQGLLVERLMLAITGIEKQADSVELPVSPGYAMVDSRTWTAKIVDGAP